VIEPDGEVDGKSIYTVATVYQDGGEADGTGHTRRPIQKLLDSPTLAARDAKKKAKTPTSTDPPSIIGQPKSREEAMADAMFKMHQEKLKKVSSHSAAKATGSSSLMKSEQRKGIKRPAINITRAVTEFVIAPSTEVMQPSSKKVATALTTVVPSPKKMGTAFASVIPLTKKAVSSCTAMILSPKKVSIPSTAVTVMPPSKTTSTKVTTTSTAALLPKTQIQRDTQAYKQAETSDRAVQIDVLKPTSAKPASAKPASTKPVSAKPISAKPKTLANVARSRSARENGYSYHTPVGELFYFRVPLTQKCLF
jgi:hypothetical protein